ncbi:Ni/Fe-hydrogenase, b-type cytochrome subunit [Geopsychrobacter electrodiphilus]|uniref:Ni/Fe-hydrogenase, b-type cytochrome subunit n=1 Tax=Geopsychrobacter electrodiphilus TaxID=225196 RepID=UPI00037D4B0E|nr:Ni/Fe-hydrogenase, b-type cytochrome subunit [Geopsychrobacter electrodiphilus]
MLQRRYVWEWPVRLTHWFIVLSIIALSVTGIYIGNPNLSVPKTSSFVMGWMRAVHFGFAYLFAVSFVVRLLWMFFGNKYARWTAFIPWASKEGWRNIIGTFSWYTFLRRKVPYVVGHNALAGIAYSFVFVLFTLQIVSGFALYGQYDPNGLWASVTAPFLSLFSNQGLRLTHHMIMWLLIGFAIHHVYSGWLMDVKEKNGTLGSIFGGYKFIDPKDL